MHVEIHREQILREYHIHNAWATDIKEQLKSIQDSVLTDFKVNLLDYVVKPMPVDQSYLWVSY